MDVKILLNPVRLRIFQSVLLHKEATVDDIFQDMSDVPKASLYRHVKKLVDANYLKVIGEIPVRGTVQKRYSISQPETKGNANDNKQQISDNIYMALFSIYSDFRNYFQKETYDAIKDMLCLRTITLMLSDDEMTNLFNDIGALYSKYINNKPGENRKQRKITIISSPIEDDN